MSSIEYSNSDDLRLGNLTCGVKCGDFLNHCYIRVLMLDPRFSLGLSHAASDK